MSQLVHIFSLTMLQFVSTSSLTVFVFPQVLRSQSNVVAGVSLLVPNQAPHSLTIGSKIAHSSVQHIHHCLLLHCAAAGFNRPIIDSFLIFQTCNRPTIDLFPDSHDRPIVDAFPDFTNSFSISFDSPSNFVRLENHAEF